MEGLFNEANKRPLPKYPKRIALVTSPAGAAVRAPGPGQGAGHAPVEVHLPQLFRRLAGLFPAQLGERVVPEAEKQLPLVAGGLAVADQV